MKQIKLIIPAIFFSILFFSCQNVQESPEYIKLKNEKDSLAGISSIRGETINDFLAEFNEIQANLNDIKQKEHLINLNSTSSENLTENNKKQIISDINLIYNKMKENQKKLAELKRKYNASGKKMSELAKTIDLLEQQIKMKDAEIKELNEKLLAMDIQIENLSHDIEELSIENEEKDNIIEEKDNNLNEVFYAIGTKKELIANNVISKEGGFIGIGKSTKLKGDFNKDYFTKADKRELKEISIFAKKAKIITPVSQDSYKFEGEGKVDKLIITQPDKFWNASKYLVIVVD